ncbi:MAG TPA: YXWGXW repeat-containing protein [Acidobacteriaceae bacterium]
MTKHFSRRLMRNAILAAALVLAPAASFAAVFISVGFAPPALPVYTQPVCPGDGYLWTPGYWAYGPEGYYWVPGVWVRPPRVGVLWTPGYWGWGGSAFMWHEGYGGRTLVSTAASITGLDTAAQASGAVAGKPATSLTTRR